MGEIICLVIFALVWAHEHFAPVVRTVGKGKMFETLQEWADWASQQRFPALWAECYAGSDLGYLDILTHDCHWKSKPSKRRYVRIYAVRTLLDILGLDAFEQRFLDNNEDIAWEEPEDNDVLYILSHSFLLAGVG
jgi:hypothetical protein